MFKISRDAQGARLTWLKVTGGTLKVKAPLSGGTGETAWEEKADQLRLYSGAKFQTTDQAPAGTVCAVTGLKNRGVKLGAPKYRDYAVNRDSKMTSCLVEVGFVDNDKDNAAFDRTFDAMADAIAEAVCVNTGLKYVRKGDVDGNGTVDVNDARTVLRAAVELEKLSPDAEKRADTDGDGKVTVNDARDILRTATGLDK